MLLTDSVASGEVVALLHNEEGEVRGLVDVLWRKVLMYSARVRREGGRTAGLPIKDDEREPLAGLGLRGLRNCGGKGYEWRNKFDRKHGYRLCYLFVDICCGSGIKLEKLLEKAVE